MNNELDKNEKGLDTALALAKKHDIHGARIALGISKEFTDDQVIDALVGLDKGIVLFHSQKHMEALEHFQSALPIVEASDDEETKFIIPILIQLAEGMSALFDGNAHLATELLNVSSEIIERLSFFRPELKITSLSCKATSLIALARAYMNAADIISAEKVFGEIRDVHDELLKILDPGEYGHAIAFGEVYGTRLELIFSFIIMMDIPALDLSMWKKRLDISRNDVESLKKFIEKIPKGPIQIILSQYPNIFSILENLHSSLEIATLKRRPFNKEETQTLVNIDSELFNSRQLLLKCGERGKGLIFAINQLRRLQQNMLQFGKAATQDFGRFCGIISFASFVLLIVIMYFTIKPTGYFGAIYYLGALILSLIVGFGYGALKFKPLLKIFADAIQKEPENG